MTQRAICTGRNRRGRLLANLLRLAGFLALAASGCEPPLPNVLVNAEGRAIRLEAITAVIDDADLTESQKRQALRDLGITDERLIDALLRGGL